MTEKISVIIVTRNRAKMLGNCLNSLLVQTRMPDEIVVVDNASSDNTKKVILSFKKKLPIKYFLEKQIGIPYARNKGLRHTTGSLILMLDDDCSADKFWVERMENAHKKYPKAWVIQGRTFSLPKKGLYSVASEFSRLLYVRNYAKKNIPMKSFFNKYFIDEINLMMCQTINFSIKASYLKKYKLFFDLDFYRGEDTDLGKQILQKSGIIMFYPSAMIGHYERSTLKKFLEQQWYIGRANAKIANKWGNFSVGIHLQWSEKFLAFLFFCKVFNFRTWHKTPILIMLIILDKICRLIGYFFEKKIISFRNI